LVAVSVHHVSGPPREALREATKRLMERNHAMTLNQSALLELSEALRAADGGDLMRLMLGAMLQALIDAEATAHIGAAAHQRTPERTTQRNGTRA